MKGTHSKRQEEKKSFSFEIKTSFNFILCQLKNLMAKKENGSKEMCIS